MNLYIMVIQTIQKKMPFKFNCYGRDTYGYCNSDVSIAQAKNPYNLFRNIEGVLPSTEECFEHGITYGGIFEILDCGSGTEPPPIQHHILLQ